ncbi:Uncharacterized protein TCM_001924 isoform 1 [Theobroma cacao]|uniref:Uncharacterized protein isoform 1 n=1 Tax=Theobroma cacao TaxID=3641 RepID=A0A061DSW8_THECC|nr:Uncharacterized protein TCM_001924 isoform 1 [Theobroma cacao]
MTWLKRKNRERRYKVKKRSRSRWMQLPHTLYRFFLFNHVIHKNFGCNRLALWVDTCSNHNTYLGVFAATKTSGNVYAILPQILKPGDQAIIHYLIRPCKVIHRRSNRQLQYQSWQGGTIVIYKNGETKSNCIHCATCL